MPERLTPMLATPGDLPAGAEAAKYGYEVKWDGVRALTYVTAAGVRATNRLGGDITDGYPELDSLRTLLGRHDAILDGEIVAFDTRGLPSFELLQRRMHIARPEAVRRLTREVPATYVVFDLLYLDGEELLEHQYTQRRALLDSLQPAGTHVQTPGYFADSGAELLGVTGQRGLEGVLAKRLDSAYLPGQRTRKWRKVKHTREQEVVVGGWKPGKGARAGGIGSLLVGVYDEQGLRFAGHVGTGFTRRALAELSGRLRPLEAARSPYVDEIPRELTRMAHWVSPRVVGEVTHTGWTAEGRLRAPSWRGLRPDVAPRAVRARGGG